MLALALATVSLHLPPARVTASASLHLPPARVIATRVPLAPAHGQSVARSTKAPVMSLPSIALAVNAASYTANGFFYLTPLRNGVIKELFGIEQADFFSPVSGAFLYLGGMHAALALQCLGTLVGRRGARDTLALMCAVHALQALIGVWRMLASRAAGKASGLWELLGAGGGPATAAALMGGLSWSALAALG